MWNPCKCQVNWKESMLCYVQEMSEICGLIWIHHVLKVPYGTTGSNWQWHYHHLCLGWEVLCDTINTSNMFRVDGKCFQVCKSVFWKSVHWAKPLISVCYVTFLVLLPGDRCPGVRWVPQDTTSGITGCIWITGCKILHEATTYIIAYFIQITEYSFSWYGLWLSFDYFFESALWVICLRPAGKFTAEMWCQLKLSEVFQPSHWLPKTENINSRMLARIWGGCNTCQSRVYLLNFSLQT